LRRRAEGLAQDRSDFSMTTSKLHKLHKIVLAGALAFVAALPVRTADKKVSAGGGTLIIGSYPKQYWIIDEATEKVVGSIPFQSGIPRRTSLSFDRKRFYTIEAAMEKVEIIDIASRKTLDTFTLSEGKQKGSHTQSRA
jgi:hypothetical protein